MSDPFDGLDERSRRRLRPAPPPDWVAPMLATLTDRPFSDPGWLFERKLDGERCLAFCHGPHVRLRSRSRKDLTGTYPELAEALADQGVDDMVLDGEVVAFDGGRTSFSRLQQRMGITDPVRARRSPVRVFFYVFDLLHLEGHDLTGLPLRDRKALLRRTVRAAGSLRVTPHRNTDGEAYFAAACTRGWEGVIAKRAESTYVSRRSDAWLKFKCVASQEFVVGGFTEPSGSRAGFGALLVGYHDQGGLRYAGKVGTGYSSAVLGALRRRLDQLEVDASPFAGRVDERRPHWVRPVLVAEVGFTEWTSDGKLRHPRFLGLRDDKAPEEVGRERPAGRGRGSPAADHAHHHDGR